MRPGLAHKLLIVLAVPIVSQLAFFHAFSSALTEVEKNEQYEQESTEALILRDRLYIDFYQRFLIFAIYRATHDEKYRQRYEVIDDEITQDFKSVYKLWANDSQKLRALKGMWKANRGFSFMTEIMMEANVDNTVSNLFGGSMGLPMLRPVLDANNSSELERLVFDLHRAQEVTEENLKKTLQWLNATLFYGSLISIAGTLACGLLFSVSMTEGLKKALLHIRAMEKGQPLPALPERKGDEIAQLDCAIVETAKEIRDAEEFQSQTTQLVAQELSEPLREISTSFEELRASGFIELNKKGTERLDHVSSELNRLRTLVDDLVVLDNVREAGYDIKISAVDLSSIATKACEVVQEFARSKNISIDCRNLSSVQIGGDAERLVQVAVNLLSNAIKFAPEGSTVSLTVDSIDGYGRLSVQDYGPGIAEEFRSHIFSRFEQAEATSKQKGSSGLGLAICKKLIEAQGGQLCFESETGKGSTFWFTVPTETTAKPAARVEPSLTKEWKPQLKQRTIALIALPVVVQIVTVLVLSHVMGEAKVTLDDTIRARRAVEIHTDIVRDIVRSISYAMLYNASKTDSDRRIAELEQRRLNALVGELARLANGDRQFLDEAHKVDSMVQEIIRTENEIMAAPKDTKLDKWLGPKAAAHTELLLTQTMEPVENALRHQRDLLDSKSLSSASTRRKVEQIMFLSAILTTVTSLGLGLFMVRGVTSKLKKLVTNAVRLKHRELLAPPLPGNDELAYVDNAFHLAAAKLTELEKFKQEMVSVTSHELRTPLTSLLALCELVSCEVFGPLSQKGQELVQHARSQTVGLIAMITNLLDTEKMQSGKILVKPQIVDMASIVTDATNPLTTLQRERQIHIESTGTGFPINADGERIAQALSAILFDVVAQAPPQSDIRIEQTRENGSVRLRVIAPAAPTGTLDHQDVHARARLSLSLSSLIAKQHGGKFIVDKEDEAQVFTFELPA